MSGQDHYVFLAGSISGIMEGVTIQVWAGGNRGQLGCAGLAENPHHLC